MNELTELLKKMEAARFYGSLEVKIEAGQVVLIRKCETYKPTQQSYGDNRGTNERINNR